METPILYVVYKRIDCVKESFAAIRSVQPFNLFIVQDGPKNLAERAKTDEVYDFIVSSIDWPCMLHYVKNEVNLGCRHNMHQAIRMFFEEYDNGIIIEDDIVPTIDFFKFCSDCLELYKDDPRIGQINGWSYFSELDANNPLIKEYQYSACFSVFNTSWGWATWRKAALEFIHDENMSLSGVIPSDVRTYLNEAGLPAGTVEYYMSILDCVQRYYDGYDTWDWQWLLHQMNQRLMAVQSVNSLTSNVGMGSEDATHTVKSQAFRQNVINEKISATYPPKVAYDVRFDMLRVRNENLIIR